jgi:hypothetical protein
VARALYSEEPRLYVAAQPVGRFESKHFAHGARMHGRQARVEGTNLDGLRQINWCVNDLSRPAQRLSLGPRIPQSRHHRTVYIFPPRQVITELE